MVLEHRQTSRFRKSKKQPRTTSKQNCDRKTEIPRQANNQQVLPTAVQTQTERGPEQPPLPPEGLNTGEVHVRVRGGLLLLLLMGFRGEIALRISIQRLSRRFQLTEY